MALYVVKDGIRQVVPYYTTFKTHIKSRWEGRTIIDVFTKELGHPTLIVQREIENHLIYLEEKFGQKSNVIKGWAQLGDRLIQKHDIIYNKRHMHEPNVLMDDSIKANDSRTLINIVYESSDLLVVNKPSGIPTHPTSNYHYNSLLEILKHDLKLKDLWPVHRLDKATSGILMFALTKPTFKKMAKIIKQKSLSTLKQYFARVKGQFPIGVHKLTCPVFIINANGGYFMPSNMEKLVTTSTTIFERVKYYDTLNESLVKCTPISGKMHQIRIHLRNLGYPISNDFLYNPTGSIERLRNELELEIYNQIFKKYPRFNQLVAVDNDGQLDGDEVMNLNEFVNPETWESIKILSEKSISRIDKYKTGEICQQCKRPLFVFEREKSLSCIWLHAFRYQHEGEFDFQTELPKWCC